MNTGITWREANAPALRNANLHNANDAALERRARDEMTFRRRFPGAARIEGANLYDTINRRTHGCG
jgi:hypothetical protein